ncbi:MAG TPA: imidazolonepropionase, partial [Hyphomicrobium sp.]|nr:imidazolonepropionase [Hyphomicrobium sp.]
MPGADRLFRNARLATLDPAREGLGIVEKGAIAAREGRILYAGPEADLPSALACDADILDCEGRWITPGLIDCHTHLVHAGDRAHEFELRLNGASYEEIARAGGGILSTVRATRAASEDDLVAQALPRLDALLAE